MVLLHAAGQNCQPPCETRSHPRDRVGSSVCSDLGAPMAAARHMPPAGGVSGLRQVTALVVPRLKSIMARMCWSRYSAGATLSGKEALPQTCLAYETIFRPHETILKHSQAYPSLCRAGDRTCNP